MENNTDKNTSQSSMTIKATPIEVWDALTNPALIKQYLFGTDVHTDWKVGSPITYTGEWEGKAYEDRGTILDVRPNEKLVTSYWSAAFGPDTPENRKTVTYDILPIDDDFTMLTITQDNNKDEAAKAHSESNWNSVLAKLKEVVEK